MCAEKRQFNTEKEGVLLAFDAGTSALKAALWGQAQTPGEYDMMDVLGL